MRRPIRFAIAAFIAALAAPGIAHAAACTHEQFAAAVDKSGAQLRAFNSEALPKLQDKLKQLKEKKGWDEEKSLGAARDARTEKLDEDAETLIVKIDTLGRPPEKGEPDCSKLAELEAAGLELLAVMKAKSSYTLGRLDAAIDGKEAATEKRQAAATDTTDTKGKEAKPTPQASAPPPKPVPKSMAQKWTTETKEHPGRTAELEEVPTMQPGPTVAMLEPLPPEADGYNIDEIREISRGFFGTISTELGSVIEYAFSSAGRPDGYVLGTEGGGAFLAGLRYGSGTLYLRSGGSGQVYWHGPSAGLDFGASGSRTMFLIYRLRDPQQLLRTFTGVDGSAYFIGGVGITFLKGGPVMMAPIRTGIGLRLGASIGYIRFTPRPTWNPF
jgi:hypothetical protein